MAAPSRLPSVRRVDRKAPTRDASSAPIEEITEALSSVEIDHGPQKRSQLPQGLGRQPLSTSRIGTTGSARQNAMPPPPSIPARSQSLRRPANATHDLTKSSSQPSSLRRTAPVRAAIPTSRVAPPSSIQRTASVRNGVSHTRSSSVSTDGGSKKHEDTNTKPPSTMPTLAASKSRPAFSTHQQHFSPAKSSLPKPPVPSTRSFASSRDEPTFDGNTFEVLKMQSELLYLSLLHQSAEPTFTAYTKSARSSLKKQFDALQRESEKVTAQEQRIQERLNTHALARWAEQSPRPEMSAGQDLLGNVQKLSRCLGDLMGLFEQGGRYQKLIDQFESWLAEATQVSQARSSQQMDAMVIDSLFVDPLPQTWHQAHLSLVQRVRLLEREMRSLPPVPPLGCDAPETPLSALEMMLKGLQSLIGGMKQELQIMNGIEHRTLEEEKGWIERTIAALALDNLQLEDQSQDVRLWHGSGGLLEA